LEEVREILQRLDIQPKFETDDSSGIRLGASILRLCLDYDYYQEQGHNDTLIIKTFESRLEVYDSKVVEALRGLLNKNADQFSLIELNYKKFAEGMILAEDLLLQENMLIASSGANIDRHLLKVISNYSSCYSESPFPDKIKVMVPVA